MCKFMSEFNVIVFLTDSAEIQFVIAWRPMTSYAPGALATVAIWKLAPVNVTEMTWTELATISSFQFVRLVHCLDATELNSDFSSVPFIFVALYTP